MAVEKLTIHDTLGKGLEEGKKYSLLSSTIVRAVGNGFSFLGGITVSNWVSDDGHLLSVAFTGEMPESKNIIIVNGVARKTDAFLRLER